jgi:alkylhydroperoxidase family enzyme
MRLSCPRIAPVEDSALDEAQAALLEPIRASGRPILNIFRTLATAPAALKGFLGWGEYVLSQKNSLPAREREIVVLRIGWLCRAGYEWTQHVPIGKRAGLTEEEIAGIKIGADSGAWSPADAAILRATDQLHHDQFITDEVWKTLLDHLTQRQIMDLVFTAGQYTQVCMMLNSFGVQLDVDQSLDPDLKGF